MGLKVSIFNFSKIISLYEVSTCTLKKYLLFEYLVQLILRDSGQNVGLTKQNRAEK